MFSIKIRIFFILLFNVFVSFGQVKMDHFAIPRTSLFLEPVINGDQKFHYQSFFGLFHRLDVAINERWVVGGGMELLTTALGFPSGIIEGQYTFNLSDKLKGSAGLTILALPPVLSLKRTTLVLPKAALKYSSDKFSVGTGMFIVADKLGFSPQPGFQITSTIKLTESINIITDNIFFTTLNHNKKEFFSIVGIRWINQRNFIDFGVLNFSGINSVFPIGLPLVSYNLQF